MKSSQIMIAIAAMLLAASFAGIAIYGDEADAVDAEDITAVAYSDGVNSRVVAVTGASITLMDAFDDENGAFGVVTDNDAAKILKYWVSNSGISYPADTEIQIANINASDVVDGRFVLTAVYEATTADFIVDSKVLEEGGAVTPTAGKVTAPVDPKKEGYTFLGWKWSAAPADDADKLYTKAEIDALTTVKPGDTFTAVFQEIYDIYWVVDGNIIAHGTTALVENTEGDKVMDLGKPIDPVRDNYTFTGWFDADGKAYTVDNPETSADEGYKFTKDTTFTAKFEADLITVTFMVGETTYDTLEVRYGGTASEIALPGGYAYWAIQTKAAVIGEDGTVTTPAEYAEYDFSKAVTSALTLYAIAAEAPEPDESIYATFNIEGTIYGPYKVTDRFSIPQTDREGYNFLGWTVQGGDGTKLTSAQVQNYQYTEDVTFIAVYEVAEPPAPEEPGFFETTQGKTVAVIVVFVIVLFIAAVYLNLWGLRSKLFGWKIERKGKE